MSWLAFTWAGIIAFCVLMYVVLDGFTLGTGMMMSFFDHDERTLAMSVILPTWDGNQTWLVLGMASLYGAFPLAFSTLLPILYIPLILMVICLLFRGVVFEFRLKAEKVGQRRWDVLFGLACLAVAFIQGTILGNVVKGFYHRPYHWINDFSVLTAITVIVGYATLGATRLILKTHGRMQQQMYRVAAGLSVLMAILLVVVSLMSLQVHPHVAALWLNKQHWGYLAIFPIVTLLAFIALWISLYRKGELMPYWSMVLIFLCCYAGFGLDIFPYVVPYKITIAQAASPDNTLLFIFCGAVVMIPVLLLYTGYSYRIFRGKTHEPIHY